MSGHDLDLLPLTLKTFSAMPTHMRNICVKFHWNPAKYWDTAPSKIGVNRRTIDGHRTAKRHTQKHNASVMYVRWRHKSERHQTDTDGALLLSCWITWDNVNKLLFMNPPSVNLWPLVPACFAFSEPAKSTRFCTQVMDVITNDQTECKEFHNITQPGFPLYPKTKKI